MMFKVVSLKICPFVQRVTALLAAKKLAFSVEYIQLDKKPSWFLEASPHGQVPLLITPSGISLFESDAIVEYLDEVSAPLEGQVSPEQKAINRAWSYMASKNYLVQCGAMRSADRETLQQRSAKLNKMFAKAEQALGEGTYFKGDSISSVDIAWLPLLHRANIIRERSGFNFLEEFPKVRRWQSALLQLPIVEQSVSDDFENAFSDFYLSSATYLGKKSAKNVNKTDESVSCAKTIPSCC